MKQSITANHKPTHETRPRNARRENNTAMLSLNSHSHSSVLCTPKSRIWPCIT